MKMDLSLVGMAAIGFGVAFILAFALTPLVKMLAHSVGAIDVPRDNRRMHHVPIPRLGGLAIFLGFTFSVLIMVALGVIEMSTQFRGMLIGAVIIVVLGAVDDVVALPALPKFIVQIAAAVVVVLHGVTIQSIANPFSATRPYISFGIFSAPITVFWIVAITNAVNLIDGLDGLAVGVSSIAAFSMLVVGLIVSDPAMVLLLGALAGACIGFLPYNFNPAKIFMGDTGALFLGFMLSTVSIIGPFKYYAVISFAVPFLILGLPIFDTAFAIIRRVLHGQSPMQADRGHVHHRLIDMGFSQKQSVTILYILSGILGLTAVVLTKSGEIKAILLVIAIIAALVIGAEAVLQNHRAKDDEQTTENENNAGDQPEDKGR